MSSSFRDLYKSDPEKSFIINFAPLFANFSLSEKKLIMEKSKLVEYKKGEIIYKQLDPPDAFYCMISGRVRIYIVSEGKEETLEYLNCGKYFGIISLLTGNAHSVNAVAANDSKALRIDKEDFQIILDKIPRLAIDLSKMLSRRLSQKDARKKKVFESKIISISSVSGSSGSAAYASNFALSLKRETGKNVILINIGKGQGQESRAASLLDSLLVKDTAIRDAIGQESASGINILNIDYPDLSGEQVRAPDKSDNANNGDYAGKFRFLLTSLTSDFQFIIVYLWFGLSEAQPLPSGLPVLARAGAFQILSQSDIIHLLTDCVVNSLRETKACISELLEKFNHPKDQLKVILSASNTQKCLLPMEISKLLDYRIYAVLPVAEGSVEYTKAIRRIAREVGDVQVGLALSGGAAFGLAHIGVIKVLEKEDIPVDVVAGVSIGAVIGSLWAAGLSSWDIEAFALEIMGTKKKTFHLLADPGFPKLSFFKGRRIRSALEKKLGKKTFQDTRFPFKVVACNLSKRQKVVYDSGSLVEAVMASLAIPGIFSPVKINGDLIIDGGVIEAIPIGTLLKMSLKKVIAVNVYPSPEDISQGYLLKLGRRAEEKKKAAEKGFLAKAIFNIGIFINKLFFPNVFDIFVNSIQTMEYVLAERDCIMADVVLRPVLTGADWFEFFKVKELIKAGVEEANNSLTALKTLSNE